MNYWLLMSAMMMAGSWVAIAQGALWHFRDDDLLILGIVYLAISVISYIIYRQMKQEIN